MIKRFQAIILLVIVALQPAAVMAGQTKPAGAGGRFTLSGGVKPSAYASQARNRALWPGSRWTERARSRAVRRGLQFIYRTSLDTYNFAQYGSDYLWCFYTLSEALSDTRLRSLARRMGHERARRWRLLHPGLPSNADASTVADYAFGSDAADSLGVRDARMKEAIRNAASYYGARAFLLFDPKTEPPPGDVPDRCDYCHASNTRGVTTCGGCKRALRMRTRQDVWYDALITAYSGEHYGVTLGASYREVLRWLPTLRPYVAAGGVAGNNEFYDTVYAITHVVYTLNDYGLYRLNPGWLPQEFQFLRENMDVAIRLKDADMLGEFMDSLRAFGLETDDPLMRRGMEYLLESQNPDGSWGNPTEKDIYLRYHPTWNAVAALSEYAWRGERLNRPELKPLLESWASENRLGMRGSRLETGGPMSLRPAFRSRFTGPTKPFE